MKLLMVVFILLDSLNCNYCYSYVPRVHMVKAEVLCRRPKDVVTTSELVMPARMKSSGNGSEDKKVYLAFKPSEHFRNVRMKMYFNGAPYQHIFTAEDLGITNSSDFNKWYQLSVDLDPRDGLENWHLIVDVDGRVIDIDTGFKWKYYWPKYFTMFATGKSQWIPRGNATVCNLLENGQDTLDAVPTVSVNNSQEDHSDGIQLQDIIQKELDKCEEAMQRQPPAPTHGQLYCPRLFDGWSCWNDTPAGETAEAPCPAFIIGFNKKRMAHKKCNPDGTWFRHPDSNMTWSNYTTCVDIDDHTMLTGVE